MNDKDTKDTNPKDALGVDKVPLHLWPVCATALGSLALLNGALKYGRSNWRVSGVRASIYMDATLRHMYKWFEGENIDKDSNLHHFGHMLACIAIMADAMYAGKLIDDRNINGFDANLMDGFNNLTEMLRQDAPKDADVHHYTIQDSNSVGWSKENEEGGGE